MENRKKRMLRFAVAMLALGMATAVASRKLLGESGLGWAGIGLAFAFIVLAIVTLVRASGEPG